MEITNITVSHSRKINHQYYGGGQFENSEHFVSLSAEVNEGEEILEVQKQLKEACREMVEKDIADEVTGFSGGLTWGEFETYLRDLTARRPVEAETYERSNKQQKLILQAVKRGLQMNKRDQDKS